MKMETKISSAGTSVQETSSGSKKKGKTSPIAMVVGGLFAFAGTVAPNAMSKLAMRLMFSPMRSKVPEPARSILARAKTEEMTINGERVVHYIWGDSGPRMLLVHGWQGDAGHMASFVEPLRKAGYQVIAIDLPAHGKSSGKMASVKHFEPCIANAAKVYGPFEGAIAHSLGAAAITFAMSRGLRFERVAFFGPVSRFASVWEYSQRMMNLSPKVMQLVIARAQKWLQITFDEMEPVRLAPALSTPLLVVHDKGDRESPFEDGTALVASWPNSKLVETEKLGHTRALRDPAVVKQVVAFMTGQETVSERAAV